MAIIHGRDITLGPDPVPRNDGGDGVDDQLGDAMSEGSLVRKPAADPPNGAEGGDAEDVGILNLGAGEEGMGDIHCVVRSVEDRGGASS